jgi:hypothetical protein
MKKENIIVILIYLLVFAVAIIYGFTVLQTHFAHSSFKEVWQYAIYIIVSVFSGVFVAGVLSEFGHLLGAKTGGYIIASWCLFYFTFYLNKDGKRKFKFASFDGLTGETKIIPNYKKKERPNPYPFLLYGTVFNAAWIVACLFLFFTYNANNGIESDLAYFFLTCGIIALLVVVYNIIPLKLDSLTDGFRLSQIKGDIAGFNERLAAENAGLSTSIASSNEKIEANKPAKFIPEVALVNVYHLLAEEKYDEVFDTLKEINEHEAECSSKTVLDAKAQYIYAFIMSKEDTEVTEFYEKEVSFSFRRDLANNNSMPVIRTYILTAGLLDGSQSEVMLALGKVIKAYKSVPTNIRHDEAILFNRALDKIIEAHPKWEEVKNYRIYE